MATSKQEEFFFTGSTPIDGFTPLGDFNTKALNVKDYNGEWEIELTRSLSTGNPRATLQRSSDGTNFQDFQDESTNKKIPVGFTKSNLRPKFIRIKFAEGAATGTFTFKFIRIFEAPR